MSYTPTEWQPGDIVTSAKLNKIETELVTLDGDASTLKSEINELADNIVPDGYNVYSNLYLNASNGNVVSSTNAELKLLVFPVTPNTNYKIWKVTSTVMRVSCSNVAVPTGGQSANRIGAHASASNAAITGTTGPEDIYLYVQLFASSDTEALRSVEANIPTLTICKDNPATIADIEAEIATAPTAPVYFDGYGVYNRTTTTPSITDMSRTGYKTLNNYEWSSGSGINAVVLRTVNGEKNDISTGYSVGDTAGYFVVKTDMRGAVTPRVSGSATWNSSNGTVLTGEQVSINADTTIVPVVISSIGTYSGSNTRLKKFNYAILGLGGATPSVLEIAFFRPNALIERLYKMQQDINALQNGGTALDTDILFWGDSLTAGAGGEGTNYPEVCADLLNASYINCGVGGESANTIAARQGGNNIIIPAGAINGDYSLDGFADVFGGTVTPLLQGHGAQSGHYVTINGVECYLANSNDQYHITEYTGSASSVPLMGTFRGATYTSKFVVIFVGQNGSTVTGAEAIDANDNKMVRARIAIIDSMISHLGHSNYVVMGLSTGTSAGRAVDDNALLAHYGNRFFPTRKMLVEQGITIAGVTPTAQDETDIAAGTVPTSLRSDGTHLNADGYAALGTMLADKIRSLGYV